MIVITTSLGCRDNITPERGSTAFLEVPESCGGGEQLSVATECGEQLVFAGDDEEISEATIRNSIRTCGGVDYNVASVSHKNLNV